MAKVFILDSFDRTVASGAGTADGGSDPAKDWTTITGVDADVNVNGTVLVCTKDTGQWRGRIGTITVENVEVYAEVASYGAPIAAFKTFDLYARYLDAGNYYLYRWNNDADATDAAFRLNIYREAAFGGATRVAGPLAMGGRVDAFKMRAQAETVGNTVVLRLKYWVAAEPADWSMIFVDTTADRILSGNYAMRLGNEATATDMTVDNFTAQQIPGGPPEGPAGKSVPPTLRVS